MTNTLETAPQTRLLQPEPNCNFVLLPSCFQHAQILFVSTSDCATLHLCPDTITLEFLVNIKLMVPWAKAYGYGPNKSYIWSNNEHRG